MSEEWKDIPGYTGYQVSSEGRVRSLDRELTQIRDDKPYLHFTKGQILAPHPVHKYYTVRLSGKWRTIHRLVALAFIPQIPGKLEIDHINRCGTDNRVCNLRWVDKSEQNINRERPLPNTGERNIRKTKQGTFNLMIKRHKVYVVNKTFKTLEEAIEYRDSLI